MPSKLDSLQFAAFDPESRTREIAKATAIGHTVNCGWVPPKDRTKEQDGRHAAILRAMPRFRIRGAWQANERKYFLWEAARAILGGKDLPYIQQTTGSCVGAGGGNMAMTAMAVEIALKGESEEFRRLWWPYTYGRSRDLGGMRGEGEGSLGSSWAEAATTDGFVSHDAPGEPDLPDFTEKDGWLSLSARTEMTWSNGGAIPANFLQLGRLHKFKAAAPCRTVDDVYAALVNGNPCTIAGMIGTRDMVPRPQSDPPVRVTRFAPVWGHQQWIDGVWDHPKLGLIFRMGNNWGADAHGTPTFGEAAGGYWYTQADLGQLVRNPDTECYAFSFLDGWPAREPLMNFSAF